MIGFSISNQENKIEDKAENKVDFIEEKPVRSVVTVHFINERENPNFTALAVNEFYKILAYTNKDISVII